MSGKVRPRSSRPSGALPEALRNWADHLYVMARLAARTGRPTHAQLTSGIDPHDWRTHLSMRERRLLEAAMAANVWEPQE